MITTVTTTPPCDVHPCHGPAFARARLPKAGGAWAFVCCSCFDDFGATLGLGRGRVLVERKVVSWCHDR